MVEMRKINTGRHVEVQGSERQSSDYPAGYEKDGLQTRGDDKDHDFEPRVSFFSLLDITPCSTFRD